MIQSCDYRLEVPRVTLVGCTGLQCNCILDNSFWDIGTAGDRGLYSNSPGHNTCSHNILLTM